MKGAPRESNVPDVASAARRMLAFLNPEALLRQLCHEARLVSGAARAFASYTAPSQPWDEGLHVQEPHEGTTRSTTTQAAIHATYRELCARGTVIVHRTNAMTASDEPEPLATVPPGRESALCAIPIVSEGDRIAGALVLEGAGELHPDTLQLLAFLCECAETGLQNANRFTVAERDQHRLRDSLRATDSKANRAGERRSGTTDTERAQTERAQAEKTLKAERAVFRSVFMNAPACICVVRGPDHVFEFANPPYQMLMGGRSIEGLPARVALPELAADGHFDLLDEVYRSGKPVRGSESRAHFPNADGTVSERFFDFVYQPMLNEHGRPEGIIAFGFDVTEQVRARRALESAHRLTESITTNATSGLLMMDARQHCTFMNPAAEHITGFRLHEVQGKPLHYFIHHSHPDGTPYPMEECPIDRALPTKLQEQGEDVFIHKDGRFYPVTFTASPIVEDGIPTGTVIELRDTTAEKAAQAERERILADLRAAIAAREEFLSIASHELRTPLTALGLQLDGIQRAFERNTLAEAPEKFRKKLEVATRQVDRLTTLIEGLLNVSHAATGPLRLSLEEFDLVALVHEVVERFEEAAKRAGSELLLRVPEAAVGTWDRTQLDQALTNLVSNALKYGLGHPIVVELAVEPESVRFVVHDRGIGIAPEDMERIFGRYERAVSPRHYGGLGLGLYISRRIVSAHGGTIRVASTPQQGATFTVVLPRPGVDGWHAPQSDGPTRERGR